MLLDYYELTILLTEGVYHDDLLHNPLSLNSKKKQKLVKALKKVEHFMKEKNLVKAGRKKRFICGYNAEHTIGENYIYSLDDIVWSSQLMHYIEYHNYVPSAIFERMLNTLKFKDSRLLTFKVSLSEILQLYKKEQHIELDGVVIRQGKKERIVITQDQLRLLDSLFVHSSQKMLNDKDYEESMAYLDFDKSSLEQIKIKLNPRYMFKSQEDFIYFHYINEKDAIDYEFMVHTHPLTPDLETRIEHDNIMFDYPSATDIISFLELFSKKQTQGSMVIAIEGMYIIRAIEDLAVVLLDKNGFQWEYNKMIYKMNEQAISTYYGSEFSIEYFLEKVIHEKKYMRKINAFLKPYNAYIEFYPRIKRYNKYILQSVTVEVVPIEFEVFH